MNRTWLFTLVIVAALVIVWAACQSAGDDERNGRQATPVPGDDDDDNNDTAAPSDDDDDDTDSPFPRCPGRPEMILIPASDFIFRYDGDRYDEAGLSSERIDLDDYCIDEFEYPNIAGEYPLPVSWNESAQLCAAIGKRLCSGPEWQKACTGPDNTVYPWGDKFDDQICNTHTDEWAAREVARAGAWPACISGYGVYDIAGNLSEWTEDIWQEGWQDRTVRGGGYNVNPANRQEKQPDGFWEFTAYSQACSSIHHHGPDSVLTDDGTRCCADP
ncbi:MAG: SUMF1/EgtB/PvdO family nonheme iron enzyme [Candidatus Lernaella stagnicola]|nr:SUMF1/EgtB/PvdO family nonheme iron enzyme [Candidatus Lernaella stagnicola]